MIFSAPPASRWANLLIFLVTLFFGTAQLQAQIYNRQYIDNSTIDALNEKGEVVSGVISSQGFKLYLPNPAYGLSAGSHRLLDLNGSTGVDVVGLNDNGIAVGTSKGANGARLLTIWTGGVPSAVGPTDDTSYIQATGINNLGHIIGKTSRFSDAYRPAPSAFFYNGSDFFELLGFGADTCSTVLGQPNVINNFDAIIGGWLCSRPAGQYLNEAYLWQGTSPTKLNTPGVLSYIDINDNGVFLVATDNQDLAILDGGSLTVFPRIMNTPGGQDWAFMNDHGEAIGTARVGSGPGVPGAPRSFIWLPEAKYRLPAGLTDLTDVLDWPNHRVSRVYGINNSGQLAVQITDESRNRAYAYILSPAELPGYIVNSIYDESDINPGDGICETSEGDCSFRAAIEECNANPGADTISFEIEISGVPVIQPITELPHITEQIVINGSSQPIIKQVEINGAVLGQEGIIDGLTIKAVDCNISHLIIDQFPRHGLVIDGGGGSIIRNNLIGSYDDLTAGNGNGFHGILIKNSSDNTIGGILDSQTNIIANNAGAGIFVESGTGNNFKRNGIFSNGLMGIDLAPMNINENDTLDADDGPNGLQNYPIVDSVISDEANSTVYGHLMSAPNSSYYIELYSSVECDPSGNGEGAVSLWTTTINSDQHGLLSFETTLGFAVADTLGLTLTATANDGSSSEFSPCFRHFDYYVQILDVDSVPIANREFDLFRVENVKPTFAGVSLGKFTTDEDGEILLSTAMIAEGNFLRVYKQLGSEPAVRHVETLGTKFSVHLDNAKFDTLGSMYYEATTADSLQVIVMDHSTFAYNLVVSVGWDMTEEYHGWLQEGFRMMANHMYDASDGQILFDTIMIFDDEVGWDEPDVRVYLNNDVWAHVDGNRAGNMNRPSGFLAGGPLEFGRLIGGDPEDVIALSVNPNIGYFQAPDHYFTLVHEFFHYAFSLFDEYRPPFAIPIRAQEDYCEPMQTRTYGIMDLHANTWDPYSSELSNSITYENWACRDNMQWYWNEKSCWGVVEEQLEGVYDGIMVPILKSTERTLPADRDYLRGPNIYGLDPEFDAYSMVIFTESPEPTNTFNKLITILAPIGGDPIYKAMITQVRTSGTPFIRKQGRTHFDGKLLALGLLDGDRLFVGGRYLGTAGAQKSSNRRNAAPPSWVYGEITNITDDGLDSAVLILKQIEGELPVATNLSISSDSITIYLDVTNSFTDLPTIDLIIDNTLLSTAIFENTADGYAVTLPFDSNYHSGSFLVHASDSAGAPYIFDIDYATNAPISGAPFVITSPDGISASLGLPDSTTGLTRVVTMSTDYPSPRDGLIEINQAIGKGVSVASAPANSLGAEAVLSIGYGQSEFEDDHDPVGLELSVQIFHWNRASQYWVPLESSVDTANNIVSANISEDGLYTAFTTDFVTDVADYGNDQLLPESILLHQNYPNPFNPETEIIFSLPVSSNVKLEIFNIAGQNVETLADRHFGVGTHTLIWNAGDKASGIYLYRLTSGEFVETKKMILVK